MKIFQPEKSIIVLRIRYTLGFLIFSFVCGIIASFNLVFSLFLFIVFFFFEIYLICFYCEKKIKSSSFYLLEKRLLINKGVYIKKRIDIQISSIEHMNKIIFPDQKLFGLCGFVLYMPSSKIYLENFDKKQSDLISEKIKECQK